MGFSGRFEEIEKDVILDGAHNPDKVRALVRFIKKKKNAKVTLVLAFKKGKKWKRMIDLLVSNLPVSQVVATEFNAVTDTGKFAAVSSDEIDKYVRFKHRIPVVFFENSQEAVFEAINSAKKELVVVTGSLYLVGEVRPIWERP